MVDEINFLDLAVLMRIVPNTPLEKLGGLINSSIFDASNIAGTLKQKSLIEFSASYPGPNAMNITETGTALINEANGHSNDPFDKLDETVLQQLSGGKRTPTELQTTLNLRPKDLAFRIYKETKQGFVTYEIKNGTVEIMLTEKGFLKANGENKGTTKPQMNNQNNMQNNINNTVATQIPQNKPNETSWLNAGEVKQQAVKSISIQETDQKNTNDLYTNQTQNTTVNNLTMNKGYLSSEKNKWIIIGILLLILIILYIVFELI
ncbi:MAG: hypothetical protein QXD23_02440 [Candidatus Micrarchaeaceae archaeon]